MKDQEIEDYLSSLDDDKMDNLFNSIADLMDSVTDEGLEEVRNLDKNKGQNFFSRIIPRNKKKKRKEYIATRIKTSFEESLLGVMQEDEGDPLLFDLKVKATIVANTESFKASSELQQLSGLEKDDYYKLVDDMIDEVMNKYFDF